VSICSSFKIFKVFNFAEGKVIELYAKHTNCANQLEYFLFLKDATS
jgi:hypothetical protein